MRRFLKNCEGAAAIEFAVIFLPILVVMLLGLLEVTHLVDSYRKTQNAAQMTADLVSQDDHHTDATLSSLKLAARLTMAPKPADPTVMGVDIASIGYDLTTGEPSLFWRVSEGSVDPIDLTLANGLAPAGGSVIYVAIKYTHTPLVTERYSVPLIKDYAFSRPRYARLISLNGQTQVP